MAERGPGAGGREVVVIGAGVNGLTAAGLLAKAGRKVLVVERRPMAGGLASGGEFHPGFRSPGLLSDSSRVSPGVIRSLELERHGLQLRKVRAGVLALGQDGGGGLWLDGDRRRAAAEIGKVSPRDAERWSGYHEFLDRVRGVLTQYLTSPPINFVDPESMGPVELVKRALKVRGLGRRDMMELLRLPPMCVADWLDEWFETDLLKVLLAWPAVAGNWVGPRSPGSNANLLIHEALAGTGVTGNGPALVEALERSAAALGVEICTGVRVEGILVDGSSIRGIRLEGGEEIRCGTVASSCDPKTTLLGLLPPGAAGMRLTHRIGTYRMRGTTGQVLLAMDGVPSYSALPGQRVEYARTGGSLLDLERAFDPVKYGELPEAPALEFHMPGDGPGPPAEAGKCVLSVLVHSLPAEPAGGWTADLRESLGEKVVHTLEGHAPGARGLVRARKVLAPPDIEEEYGVTSGHIHHGEHALDQLLIRPVPECYAYATPVEGLYLCGMGSHPGGGLTCRPGELAAAAILAGRRS